jgi:trk system potassium uptake protein TrkH
MKLQSLTEPFIRRRFHPAQLVVFSFALVIFIGTALLSLPFATSSGKRMPLIDALFTATSATCVTGLVVVDTGAFFSTFGQLVILGCIQIGGLSLVTFTTVFLVTTGRRLAIADRIAIQESFHHTPTGKLPTLIKYIVIATFTIEAAGALIMTLRWLQEGRYATVGETIYYAVFHSVSAFCNAGFALYADSLTRFQGDPVVVLTIGSLIVIGGLGFIVGLDVKEYVRQAIFNRFRPRRGRAEAILPRPRLSLHSKFALLTTITLLAVGIVSYYVLERQGVLAGMGSGQAWLNAYFCSVTPRTAGFNTVDFSQMGGAALLCTMVLMFIGAGPGSTGGGIKTSTFALLIVFAASRWRGYARLHVFKRTVPQEAIDKASSVVIASAALVILASSALMATETYGQPPGESRDQFLSILFETISAFGTVGLSVGQTSLLSDPGRLIISLVMFLGRTGPLTLALAIGMKRKREHYRYAEENIMIG